MERRDPTNARLEALRESADGFKAAGEKVPEHLAGLLKQAEKGAPKREERKEQAAEQPKATKVKGRDGTGYYYEHGHGLEPKHADSTDAQGYPVGRPPDAPGTAPLPDYATSDYDAIEPVEKYPDFANPLKKGDLIPEEAHARDVVPEHLKGKASGPEKAMEKVKEEREAEAEKASRGEPLDPEKALNPVPDPHQSAVAKEGIAPTPPAKSDKGKAESARSTGKAEPKGATQSNRADKVSKQSAKGK